MCDHGAHVMREKHTAVLCRPLKDLWIGGPGQADVLHPHDIQLRQPAGYAAHDVVVKVFVKQQPKRAHDFASRRANSRWRMPFDGNSASISRRVCSITLARSSR